MSLENLSIFTMTRKIGGKVGGGGALYHNVAKSSHGPYEDQLNFLVHKIIYTFEHCASQLLSYHIFHNAIA